MTLYLESNFFAIYAFDTLTVHLQMDLLRTEWKGKGQSEIAMARLHFTSLNKFRMLCVEL